MKDMGVKDNVYTTLTLDYLEKSRTALEVVVQKRDAAYKTELARQRANDALCKEFASLADRFVKSIGESKDVITQSKADLEEQLKFVNGKVAGLPKEEPRMKPISDLFAKMEAAGITNNKYTTYTAKDVEVQFEQYKAFLRKKVKMLEEEIEHHKLRGVTPEQFREFEANFKQFDADNSGDINKKELKACLYSLGEERSRGEVEQIMKKYGSKDPKWVGIKYEQFNEFMIEILGVSVTKDDIMNSFLLINKGDKQVSKLDNMEIVMETPDITYFKQTAKAASGGYDYVAWTNDVFSR